MEEAGVVDDGDVPAQLVGLAFADSDADVGAAATCPAESTAPTAEAADDDHTSAAAFCKSKYPPRETYFIFFSFSQIQFIIINNYLTEFKFKFVDSAYKKMKFDFQHA